MPRECKVDCVSFPDLAIKNNVPALSLAGIFIGMRVGLGPGLSVSVGDGVIGYGVIVTKRSSMEIVLFRVGELVGASDGAGPVSTGGGYGTFSCK